VGDSVGPLVTITPSILQFPLQFVGSRSVPQQFTVRNSGLQPSTLSNISTSGDFKETNNCPAVLVPASLCRISVTYKPSSVGSGFGVMGITHDQATDNGFLGGFGSASAINASTAGLEFGSQFVGQAPLARIVNFTNATPYPATVTGISVSQGFAQTNTCTVPLPPHGSCRVAVTFNPPANLSLTGLLTAAIFCPGGAQTVSLIG